jgi:GlcNAc-P-P-Und epimerase
VESLLGSPHEIVNLDLASPKLPAHQAFWRKCDILSFPLLDAFFKEFKPTHVIHLAARTDVRGKTVQDYPANVVGTENVVLAAKRCETVERILVTSSQFVHQSGSDPSSDEDYAPFTAYGESKVLTEKITRDAGLTSAWTIIRPTNIWGPWHPRYPYEFWRVLAGGKYFHPGKERVIRSYGFVDNVVWQTMKLVTADLGLVNRRVFYLGDRPLELFEWVNGFSVALTGRPVKILPRSFLKLTAMSGDVLNFFNLKFPITSSRYRSMTVSNPAPMEATFELLGLPPYSLQEGIAKTVEWIKSYYPELVKTSHN